MSRLSIGLAITVLAGVAVAFAGQPPGLSDELGIPCSIDAECFDIPLPGDDGFCVDGVCCENRCAKGTCAIVHLEGTCVAEQDLERCDRNEDCSSNTCTDGRCCRDACPDGYCGNDFGVCIELQRLGAQCEIGAECQSGFCANSRCCNRECRDLFCSRAGRCVGLGFPGNRCEEDAGCESGFCRDGRCCTEDCATGFCGDDGVCRLLLDLGKECQFDGECTTGICDLFEGVCCRRACNDLEDCNSGWAPGHCVPFLQPCAADCDDSGTVSIDELVRGVSIALGDRDLEECPGFDHDRDGRITISELIAATLQAITECELER